MRSTLPLSITNVDEVEKNNNIRIILLNLFFDFFNSKKKVKNKNDKIKKINILKLSSISKFKYSKTNNQVIGYWYLIL